MPELPFVAVLVENLRAQVEGRTIDDVLVRSVYVLKTFDPPITDIKTRRITRIERRGKLLVFHLSGGLAMVVHLRRNGRLQILPRGKGRTARDLAITFALDGGADLQLIELGPKKAASVWLFPAGHEPTAEPLAGLGLEPLAGEFTREALAGLLGEERTHLKRFLTLQRHVVGIGNAFADEILWEARLSPQAMTNALDDAEVARLHGAIRKVLEEAVAAHRKEFAGALPMREPVHLLRVHRHGKEPCPRCGTAIAVIYYEDRETYYCPTCQAGGKVYADRRRSRLLR
ncbi:MAG TPA: DNA-formamidopyrimidine glycosylase family protein [bacterium]|nr:DNA-formamidopyrimidine glycosylase family protein [bacterium]